MKDIKIIVATHKKYRMPKDGIYLPLQVGAALHPPIGYQRDDSGEHISEKNAGFCELTGLYWAWKNLDADYLGLVHYRRYFAACRHGDKWRRIAGRTDIEKVLETSDIILPSKRHYFIETNYSQYVHAHHASDLELTRAVIEEFHPGYLNAFDICMKRTSGHKFNMFIMKRKYVDLYCEWLFDILFELERRLDISSYSANDARVFGYVAERLLDVWVEKNNMKYREMKAVYMEKRSWVVKGWKFLRRKFANRGSR